MKKIIRWILSGLAITTLTGCAELHTKEPFGAAIEKKKSDELGKEVAGLWYSPETSPGYWQSFEVKPGMDGRSEIVARNTGGKVWEFEAVFRNVEGKDSGGPAIFFRKKDGTDAGWRFAWLGSVYNSGAMVTHMAGLRRNTLVLVFPDSEAAKKLGLNTSESRYKTFASGIPPLGVVVTPIKGAEEDQKEAAMSVLTLTDSPEVIAAALKDKDLRTMMLPTTPVVLIRQNLLKPNPAPELKSAPVDSTPSAKRSGAG